MKTQVIYMALKVPSQLIKGTIKQVLEIKRSHPAAPVEVDALAVDGDRICLYIRMDVPVSNTHPAGIAALQFAHSLNLNMYEHMPTYSHAPQQEEKELARRYLESILQEDLNEQRQFNNTESAMQGEHINA